MAEIVDLEVGRYALRTFTICDGRMRSIARESHYWGETCEAKCLVFGSLGLTDLIDSLSCSLASSNAISAVIDHYRDILDKWEHDAPREHCGCGIYGSLSLDHLKAQYPKMTKKIVAVIAAEGTTIIGTRGLRTQYARVVAYRARWIHRDVANRAFPNAKSYRKMDQMLADYHLPKVGEGSPEKEPSQTWQDWWST